MRYFVADGMKNERKLYNFPIFFFSFIMFFFPSMLHSIYIAVNDSSLRAWLLGQASKKTSEFSYKYLHFLYHFLVMIRNNFPFGLLEKQ